MAVSKEKTSSDHIESGSSMLQTEPQGKENVPAGHVPVTSEEKALSRALNRKLDVWLLPFLSLLYLFNGLDRGNVGNAETQGKTTPIPCLANKADREHRVHQGHRRSPRRPQPGGEPVFHHVRLIPAALSGCWEMDGRQKLDPYHYGNSDAPMSLSGGLILVSSAGAFSPSRKHSSKAVVSW